MSRRSSRAQGILPGEAAPAPSAGRKSKRKAAVKPDGMYVEPGEQPLDAALVAVTERTFWEQFGTEYLFAWAVDYEEWKVSPLMLADREGLLRMLVEKGAERPKEGTEEEQLVRLWRLHVALGNEQRVPPPLRIAHVPVSPASPVPPQSKKAKGEQGDTPPCSNLVQQFHAAASASASPAAAQPLALSPRKGGIAAASPHSSSAQVDDGSGSGHAPADKQMFAERVCRICGHVQFVFAAFTCESCKYYGHLSGDNALNAALAAERVRIAGLSAPTSAAGPSASTSTASLSSAASASSALSRLDKWLTAAAKEGVDVPLFTGSKAGDPLSHGAARAIVDKALDADTTMAPSAALIELIRVGKLKDIGFALPRPIKSKLHDDSVGLFAITEAGTFDPVSKAALTPPQVQSSQQFCMALFSTILPALVDKPAAMMEWCALARTALVLESKYNWPAARDYVERVLTKRINTGQGIAEIAFDTLHGIGLDQQRQATRVGAQGPSSSPSRGTTAASVYCLSWNDERGCSRAVCKYLHQCKFCHGAHRGKDCSAGAAMTSLKKSSSKYSVATASVAARSAGAAAAAPKKSVGEPPSSE
jgi:hypothetical protein